jgi:hypothetical protein
MPIEKLNMWIKESVISNISKWQICQFIKRLNFMQHVIRSVKLLVHANRKPDTATLKDVQVDVDTIKEFLRSHIGTTFNQATAPSDDNQLSVDMSDWGGLRYPRANAPFAQVRNSRGDVYAYVREQLGKLCPWHQWQ